MNFAHLTVVYFSRWKTQRQSEEQYANNKLIKHTQVVNIRFDLSIGKTCLMNKKQLSQIIRVLF